MESCIIEWRAVPFAEGWEDLEPDEIVWVDVALLDAAWRETSQWIGPDGVGQQDNRYAKFGIWFADGAPVEIAFVTLTKGELLFGNGRHRFAWLRDQGVRAIPVQISPDNSGELKRRFGTELRECAIPLTRALSGRL